MFWQNTKGILDFRWETCGLFLLPVLSYLQFPIPPNKFYSFLGNPRILDFYFNFFKKCNFLENTVFVMSWGRGNAIFHKIWYRARRPRRNWKETNGPASVCRSPIYPILKWNYSYNMPWDQLGWPATSNKGSSFILESLSWFPWNNIPNGFSKFFE